MASKVPTKGKLLYGGDYNPEQWLDHPEILEADVRMMKKAHINTVSMGIFSWAALEREDGVYDFSWLEERINTLYENGIYTMLATPTGSRPKWLADKYPDVLRVDERGVRQHYGFRHNHCMTSPSFRKKTYDIDRRLSEKFGRHPGVIGWHINNEMGGYCYCPLCQEKFRSFLQEKYHTIENVNRAWNTTFWSHIYNSFDEIEAPSPIGELFLHGLNEDWKRFTTLQHKDFTENEIRAIRDGGSDRPVTMNLMYDYTGLNYQEFADDMDFMSWDNYPAWGKKEEKYTAFDSAFEHDRIRSIQRKPYLLMESCPTSTNWQPVSHLKAPGLLEAQELQAIAHGADGALYFQIRQSRGASEKFHGAVIDHYGGEDTRVFQEAVKTGAALESLREVIGSEVHASAAVLYDMESRWAMEDAQGPRNCGLHYREAVEKSYNAFRRYGLDVDVIDETQSLDRYRIVAAPMVYMFRESFAERLRTYVNNGGILILTYWSGIVDDTDLCFLGGNPHDFMDVCGFRSAEIDGLYDGQTNSANPVPGSAAGLPAKTYSCSNLCEILELRGAKALYTYNQDFYAGEAAVTKHAFGKGMVYGVACDFDQEFYNDFYQWILEQNEIRPILFIPDGVEVTEREGDDGSVYIFLINWNREPAEVEIPQGYETLYAGSGRPAEPGRRALERLECVVLKREK